MQRGLAKQMHKDLLKTFAFFGKKDACFIHWVGLFLLHVNYYDQEYITYDSEDINESKRDSLLC